MSEHQNPSVEEIRDQVADKARDLLPLASHGIGAQVAPLNESQLRVTYKDGSFRILDVGGFIAVGNLTPQAVHEWTYAMLVGEGPLPSHVPVDEMRPTIVGTDVPEWVLSRPAGDGLVEAIVRGEGYVSRGDISVWDIAPERVFTAVRRTFGVSPFQPEQIGDGAIELASDDWCASAWAFYPTVLKMALGVFDAAAWVWLPDSGHLVAAPASEPAAIKAAAARAAEIHAASPRPLATEPYVAHGRLLAPATAD